MGHNVEFIAPGDYIIGGLFNVHEGYVSANSIPLIDTCERATFNTHGYHLLQALRLAIEEINNSSSLLPNITLGYELYDTCSASANIYGTLKIISQCSASNITIQNNFTDYRTKAIAVVGPAKSSSSFVTSSILSMFLVPEISYGASHKYLSDKQIYPSFLRTIPSDSLQVKLMLQLLQRFNWTWIAIVGSDDAYGSQGLQDLYTLATGHGICVPYHGLIPYTLNRSDIKKMVAGIQNSRVKVIVVFALASYVNIFFEEVVDANITGCVWIGSEDWSADVQIAQIPNLHSIGSILGVSISEIQFPELLDFEISYVNSFKGKDTRYGCNQICQECRAFTLQDMSTPSPFSMSFAFNVYSAVYTIAYGLHELLHCKSGQCVKDIAYPWQLLEKVKKVNFTLYNQSVSFDSNGDPSTGYGIGMWSWNEDSPIFRIIGSYNKMTGILQLNGTLKWHTKDNSVPESFCSKPCDNGERRVQTGFYTCCFNCFSCPEMTFLNKSCKDKIKFIF
ncbi:hypothetical protein GDO81_014087 [Engystomops pustulosus]|uniref:Receptor ligand binding region domain-containing protein n=1 Tax=Engystomops pustulosus TaxID=76066 RepID=A0AAV7B7U5_ENGPU|nr:hypothetical protein GDO81_014087 [Engystomops pustulosus]